MANSDREREARQQIAETEAAGRIVPAFRWRLEEVRA